MPQIVCNISLDVSVNDAGQSIMAKCGDSGSRLLCVRFTDCGKELAINRHASVLLNIARGDEQKSFAGAVDGEGRALFTIPLFALECAGKVECDVSAVDADGSRLTSSAFVIEVEESVCPSDTLLEAPEDDVVGEWLASESLLSLVPERTLDGPVMRPAVNRKYRVDLSGDEYILDGAFWDILRLELPTPENVDKDAWILLYCHAPIHEVAGPVLIDWAQIPNATFANGGPPDLYSPDFDIICTYSHLAGKWQIGVVQYREAEVKI